MKIMTKTVGRTKLDIHFVIALIGSKPLHMDY
jgi:hypothetical protein